MVIWGIALAGSAIRIGWRATPSWLPPVLYLYTLGTVVFAAEGPRLWPGTFGSLELWHVFVLAGSTCPFVLMICYTAPAA